MHQSAVLLIVLVVSLASACGEELPLTLQPGAPVRVFESGAKSEHALLPESDSYRKLAGWITHNKSGWSPILATPPGGGVRVECGKFSVQFFESRAIAYTQNGVFIKSVTPSEYSFLRGTNGT